MQAQAKNLHITGHVIRLSISLGVVLLLAWGLHFVLPVVGAALLLPLLPVWLVLAAWLVWPVGKPS